MMYQGPSKSPWGKVQTCDLLCPGVFLVSTASHGGTMVSTEVAAFLSPAACADFKRILDGGKLPKMDALKEEGRKLAEQKKKLYAEYRKAKADMLEVTTIKANIDYLLGYSEPGRKKEQER